jgi:hypothetical protein
VRLQMPSSIDHAAAPPPSDETILAALDALPGKAAEDADETGQRRDRLERRTMSPPPLSQRSPPKRPEWVKECQFIEGDTSSPDAMCRAPLKPGSVYCEDHHAICFTPYKPRAPEPVPE